MIFTQSSAIDFEHTTLKKIGYSDEEIVRYFTKRYNKLILENPFSLMGKRLLNEEEMVTSLKKQTDI